MFISVLLSVDLAWVSVVMFVLPYPNFATDLGLVQFMPWSGFMLV